MLRFLPLLFVISFFAACGVSVEDGATLATAPIDRLEEFFDDSATGTATLSIVDVDLEGSLQTRETGVLDRSQDRINGSVLSGDLSADRLSVALDNGENAEIFRGPFDFVASYSRSRPFDTTTFGVLAIETPPDSLPSTGSAIYNGSSQLLILEGAAAYELSGVSRLTADFNGNGSVSGRMSNLDGVRTDANGSLSVTNVVEIVFTGNAISASGFTGGSVTLEASKLNEGLTGSEVSVIYGTFAGPTAEEVAGGFSIDDTAVGRLYIGGIFLGR
jgi:hypothetical protein